MLASESQFEEDAWTGVRDFASTHWSVVLLAQERETSRAHSALEDLCRTYWYPLYAFVRRQGYRPADAQDLTQAFFAHLLRKDFLHEVSPAKGRFRTFLLACLKRFLADQWDKKTAAKRGGGQPLLWIDEPGAEQRYGREPRDPGPDALYERRWALDLLDGVLNRLQQEFTAAGKSALFAQLEPLLLGDKSGPSYPELAPVLGLSEGALKMTVHRMRQRYREIFREDIAQTVGRPSEVEEEMHHLLQMLSG